MTVFPHFTLLCNQTSHSVINIMMIFPAVMMNSKVRLKGERYNIMWTNTRLMIICCWSVYVHVPGIFFHTKLRDYKALNHEWRLISIEIKQFSSSLTVVKCSALQDPINGHLTSYSQYFGSIAQYYCDHGYQLNGSSLRRCQSNGTWTGNEPVCECKLTVYSTFISRLL
jgi:hypothetical protein